MAHSPLLLQLVVILLTARLLSFVLRYLGQPPVIGEMIAGLMLGPLVLGSLAPEFHAQLFAPSSLSALQGVSQIGLVLFNQARTVSFAIAIACAIALYLFLTRTGLGRALRAAADNPIAADQNRGLTTGRCGDAIDGAARLDGDLDFGRRCLGGGQACSDEERNTGLEQSHVHKITGVSPRGQSPWSDSGV